MNDVKNVLESPDVDARERMWAAVDRRVKAESRRWPKRLGVIAVLIAAAAVSVPAMAGATSAGFEANQAASSGGMSFTPEQIAEIEHQATLLAAVDALGALDGYADSALQPESNSIRVLWKGELTRQAKKVIAENLTKGIATEIVYVDHEPEEINAMIGKMSQVLRVAGFDVWSLAPANNYSSIEVKGTDLTSADQEKVSKLARKTIGNVPVKVVPFDPVTDGNPVLF